MTEAAATSQRPNIPTWKAEPLPMRMMNCVRLLVIHGALTEAERDRAVARIRKHFQGTVKRS